MKKTVSTDFQLQIHYKLFWITVVYIAILLFAGASIADVDWQAIEQLALQGGYNEAILKLNEILNNESECEIKKEALNKLAQYHNLKGEYIKVHSVNIKLLELDCFDNYSERQTIYSWILDYLRSQRRYKDAISVLKQQLLEVRNNSEEFGIRNLIAEYSQAIGDLQTAKNEYMKLLDLGVNPMSAAQSLSRLYSAGVVSLDELESVADMQTNPIIEQRVRVIIANAMLSNGQAESAKYQVDKLIEKYPDRLNEYILNAVKIYKSLNEEERILNLIEQKIADTKLQMQDIALFAQIFSESGRLETMEKLFGQIDISAMSVFDKENLARTFFDMGKYDRAEAIYIDLICSQPANIGLTTMLSRTLYAAGKKNEALRVLNELPDKIGNSPFAYRQLAMVFDEFGMPEQAVNSLKIAKQKGYWIPYMDVDIANYLLKSGDVENALLAYINVGETAPSYSSSALTQLIYALQLTDSNEEVIEKGSKLLKSLSKDSSSSKGSDWLWEALLTVCSYFNKYKEVVQIASLNPSGDPIAIYKFATQIGSSGALREALDLYSLIPKEHYIYNEALIQLGQILLRLKDYRKAEALLLEGLAKNSMPIENKQEILWLLAEIYINLKDPCKVLQTLSEINQNSLSKANVGNYYIYQGHSNLMLGVFDKAEQFYKIALDSAKQEDTLFYLGESAFAQGKYKAAHELYRQYLEESINGYFSDEALSRITALILFPLDALEKYSQATLFAFQNRYEDAIEAYRNCAARLGEHPAKYWTIYEIATIKLELGENEQAASEFEIIYNNADDISLKSMAALGLAKLDRFVPGAGSKDDLQKILNDFPDTLASDLAQIELNTTSFAQ